MTGCVINPRRSKNDPQIPATGILAVNPAECAVFAELARKHGLHKNILFNAQLYSNTDFFLAGPAVGAPMAAMCLEKLIALGARRIVVYGWCGSLCSDLRAGDLFVPTGGLSEEGTSVHYPVSDVQPDAVLRHFFVTTLHGQGYRVIEGPIWTTDAVYRETKEKVASYSMRGIMAVDMEFTALCAVAAYRQVRLAGVMLVSDELFHREWTPAFQHKSFRARSRKMLEILCTQSGHW